MTLYKNRYRIESTRLPHWDYSSNGYYFVTLCTHDRQHFFGEISGSKMEWSDIGRIAQQYWSEIPDHFPFVRLDEYVVMPNHVHGIVVIDKNLPDSAPVPGVPVETRHAVSLPNVPNSATNQFSKPIPHSLSTIVRSYKSAVKKWSTDNRFDFAWQSNYHDHIIRDQQELDRIRDYIASNPANWKQDDHFADGLH